MNVPGRAFCLASTLLASALGLAAQTVAPPHGFYALRPDSRYEEGCFDPCMCPILIQGPARGGFRLEFEGSDGLFDHYSVERVKWTVRLPQQPSHLIVTGSGTYRVGGQVARQHQLTLDLQVGDEPVQRFDSGLVTTASDFPAIDARISIHGEFCRDTVFEVHARPVRHLGVSGATLEWSTGPPTATHDAIWGSLGALREGRGDFSAAVRGCLANNIAAASVQVQMGDPPPGEGYFFLLRDIEGPMPGSFDSGSPQQVAPQDDLIAASPLSCP